MDFGIKEKPSQSRIRKNSFYEDIVKNGFSIAVHTALKMLPKSWAANRNLILIYLSMTQMNLLHLKDTVRIKHK